MKDYLFIAVDREDASQSTTFHFGSNLEPKLAFRTALLEHQGEDEGAEEYYEAVIKDDVVVGKELVTYDEEMVSFILIPLKK